MIVAQSAVTARAYAVRHQQLTDENSDLVGLAVANVTVAMSGAFVVDGSPLKRRWSSALAGKARWRTIYHTELFAYFLQRMHDTPDGDGSLLNHNLILYGGGMGNGNLHRHNDLPCLLAGKLGGQIRTGNHLIYPQDTPMTNLLLAILDKVGVRIEKLGDSTGIIQPNPLSLG